MDRQQELKNSALSAMAHRKKELTPVEAYAALIKGKTIEHHHGQKVKLNERYLCFWEDDWKPFKFPEQILLNLTGYTLVSEKKKITVECWVNVFEDGANTYYESEQEARDDFKKWERIIDGQDYPIAIAVKLEKEIEIEAGDE